MAVTRLLEVADAPVLAALLQENRAALAPWEPRRDPSWLTPQGQAASAAAALEEHRQGRRVPLVIVDDQHVVGALTLQSVIRGYLQSCSVGYWLATRAQGLATAAVREGLRIAFDELRLHRVQAETLVHNGPSRAVLARCGFTPIGVAPAFLEIAGAWQDCVLYQLLTPTPGLVVTP